MTGFACACMDCRMGLMNHCTGPNHKERMEEWTRRYSDACADFVLMLGLGVVTSDEARAKLRERIREIQPLLEQKEEMK